MNDDSIAWHDYQPDGGRIPHHVTCLRIGFIQQQHHVEGAAAAAETTLAVPRYAFRWHRNLKQVQIYLTVVSRIGGEAFYQCEQLEKVEFLMMSQEEGEEPQEKNYARPSQLTLIEDQSFSGCYSLRSVMGLELAAESLQEIGNGALSGCTSLTNLDFLSRMTGLQSLGPYAFLSNKIVHTIDLSKALNITVLPGYTFHSCTELKFISLPPNLREIGSQTFWGCSALEQIDLPKTLQTISFIAFGKCCKLKSIVLPSSLQQIGWNCFEDCCELIHVVLPSPRMPFLKTRPFNFSCTSLSSLELPDSVPRQQWPLILEQFSKEDGIARSPGGIVHVNNRNTTVWSFLCQHIAQLFIEDNAAMSRRRRRVTHL